LHFELLAFPNLDRLWSMIIMVFLFAQPVEEGTDAAIVQNDDQAYQDGVKGTHEDIVRCVVHPLKGKWKHDSVLPILDLTPFPAERSADIGMTEI
jgi:hypothetical protein